MTIKVMQSHSLFEDIENKEKYLSLLDHYFLMRFHPRKIVCDLIGVIWGSYFVWNNDWLFAVIAVVVMGGLGLFFTMRIDAELMSQTIIGKIGLLHKHPINLTLNLIGIITLINGLWTHNAEVILVGVSVIIMGHFFGWSKVNSKLRMI